MDLVIFAGPVIVKPSFKQIPWRRPTTIIPIVGSGSTFFANLASQLRDSNGRVLPGLLRRYAGVERSQVDKVAMCSFSAGWGLLNSMFRNEADRREVNACVLSDSAFGAGLHGHAAYAADAILGRCLTVATTTNNSANPQLGIMRTARQTWREIQEEAIEASGCHCQPNARKAREPMPAPSGGVWNTGSLLYWYDYVVPGSPDNQGDDFTHVQHHDMAALAWTAYLAPYFNGEGMGEGLIPSWKAAVGVGIAATGLGVGYYLYRTRKRRAA